MAKNNMRECKSCGHEIAAKGKVTCPNCGAVNNKPIYKRAWFIILAVILVFGIIGSSIGGSDDTMPPQDKVNIATTGDSAEDKPESNEMEDKSVSNETVGQKNALGSAKNYLSFSGFSEKGLAEQLEFEGYTSEEANYAVANCGANWNEQAAKSAKNYLSFTSFSRKGLIEQLEFEGYTYDQAVFGADSVGL